MVMNVKQHNVRLVILLAERYCQPIQNFTLNTVVRWSDVLRRTSIPNLTVVVTKPAQRTLWRTMNLVSLRNCRIDMQTNVVGAREAAGTGCRVVTARVKHL
jgi:precorrin-3B methylase